MLIGQKNNNFYNELLNVFLRISPVAAKFLIVILLADVFSLEDYTQFNLTVTLITLGIYFFGVDFYHFSNREIIQIKTNITSKITSSLTVYAVIYVSFWVFGGFFLKKFSFIDEELVGILMLVMTTEHLNQECYRLYICFKKIKKANAIFFIRGMTWTIYILFLFFFGHANKLNIFLILKAWGLSNLLALILVVIDLGINKSRNELGKFSPDRAFIKKGLRICFWVFISTLSLKMMEYSGRYISDVILGSDKTAVFVFYSSIAISMSLYINTVVTSFEYPKLVESVFTDKFEEQKKQFKKKLNQHLTISVALLLILGYFFSKSISAEIYLTYYYILPLMIVGTALMNYSLVYHFEMYSKGEDKLIIKINIWSGILTIIVSGILIYFLELIGAALSVVFSGGIIFYLRQKFAS